MEQKELESLVTRLLDTKSITAKEAIELLKLNQPVKEYIYIGQFILIIHILIINQVMYIAITQGQLVYLQILIQQVDMYKEIQDLISQALKAGDTKKLNTLRLIKSEFLLAEKNKVEINDSIEQKILSKMITQRQDSIEQYKKANRLDLVQKEEDEIKIIKEYLPEQPSEEFLSNFIRKTIDSYKETNSNMSMKDIKIIISLVKEKYDFPIVGKLVSQIMKEYV